MVCVPGFDRRDGGSQIRLGIAIRDRRWYRGRGVRDAIGAASLQDVRARARLEVARCANAALDAVGPPAERPDENHVLDPGVVAHLEQLHGHAGIGAVVSVPRFDRRDRGAHVRLRPRGLAAARRRASDAREVEAPRQKRDDSDEHEQAAHDRLIGTPSERL